MLQHEQKRRAIRQLAQKMGVTTLLQAMSDPEHDSEVIYSTDFPLVRGILIW